MKDLKYRELSAIVNEAYFKSKNMQEEIKQMSNDFKLVLYEMFEKYRKSDCDYEDFMAVVNAALREFVEFLRRLKGMEFELDDIQFQIFLALSYIELGKK